VAGLDAHDGGIVTEAVVIEAVRELLPRIRAAADAIEAGRRLPIELVHALADAGVFRLCVPRAVGGSEAHPAVLVDVLETIATADGSAGWCAMIGATSAIVSGYLSEPVAREIYGDPHAVTGGVYVPRGTAVPEGSAFRVSGRWPFASGGEHCAWLMGGCLVRDGGPPRARLFLLPASDVRIIDTWNVAGLRGTGSHDMAVDGVLVPADRSVSFMEDRPRATGPLYAFPVFGLLAMGIAAVALGIARAAIDELVRLAREKSPQGSRRTIAERGVVQAHVAEAEALVRSGRAFVDDAIGRAWSAAASRGTIGTPERAALRLAATHATANAAKATNLMYDAGGGTSVYATSPLQRCFRDVHVATQHAMVAGSTYELTGRLFLGLDTDVSQL
jgi:alkylation response protein AidB-like acyl-CoA dehydrogenase